MPIKAADRKRYNSKPWRTLSKNIRELRAEGRCECTGECGAAHANGAGRCVERDGRPAVWASIQNAARAATGATVDAFASAVTRKFGLRPIEQDTVSRILGFFGADVTPVEAPTVVLTCAHLDHGADPERFLDPRNVAAMCQKCHLAFDQEQHLATRRRRLDGAAARDLFDTTEDS